MRRNCTAASLGAFALLLTLSAAGTVVAQQLPAPAEEAEASRDAAYYYPAAPRKAEDSPTIARQKAMARGEQRMARLNAMRWYGFSNSRPTATAMPFTTMYSPAWQMPGGRPFAWYYTTSRPIVIYSPASHFYR